MTSLSELYARVQTARENSGFGYAALDDAEIELTRAITVIRQALADLRVVAGDNQPATINNYISVMAGVEADVLNMIGKVEELKSDIMRGRDLGQEFNDKLFG